jgi:hypothetical protein
MTKVTLKCVKDKCVKEEKMRRHGVIATAVAGVLVLGSLQVIAAPVNGAGIAQSVRSESPVQDARLYCHRGRVFLHWGPCHPHYWHRHYWHRHYW